MAHPLSPKNSSTRNSQIRTDSMIGVDVRVEGNVTFSGILCVEGTVAGDISCAADSAGTLIVGQSGTVAGIVRVPRVVVKGRIQGVVRSSDKIEVHGGAHIAGDAYYRAIDINAGGVIEGTLTPTAVVDRLDAVQESGIRDAAMHAATEYENSTTQQGPVRRLRRIVFVAALLTTVIAVALLSRNQPPGQPPVADARPELNPSLSLPAASGPATTDRAAPLETSKAVAEEPAPNPPGDIADARTVGEAAAADRQTADTEKVVAVQGVNPAKPAGVILVISKEDAVLFRKKRQDPSGGTRIDVSRGATETIAVARNEIFRVESGRELQIFYQGRKVAPKTIESGGWMNFVPQSSGDSGGSR